MELKSICLLVKLFLFSPHKDSLGKLTELLNDKNEAL